MGSSTRQVGRDYGLGKPRLVKGRWQEGLPASHQPPGMESEDADHDTDELLKGSNVRPVQAGPNAPRREIGQSVESVEDMIARCFAGESALTVVESALSREKKNVAEEE